MDQGASGRRCALEPERKEMIFPVCLDVRNLHYTAPPARLHPVEIAADVELQQCRGMIGGPARYFRRHAFEPEFGQIERIDVRVQRANRIALIDPIIEAFGQQNPRSAPTMKRFIRSSANRARILPRESNPAMRFRAARVIHDRGGTVTWPCVSAAPQKST